uniref:Uncharacterized protein n=1 Tax=viral metagenome TaxID=1070528 RepID=A0A2V0RAY2_9ZZZZ
MGIKGGSRKSRRHSKEQRKEKRLVHKNDVKLRKECSKLPDDMIFTILTFIDTTESRAQCADKPKGMHYYINDFTSTMNAIWELRQYTLMSQHLSFWRKYIPTGVISRRHVFRPTIPSWCYYETEGFRNLPYRTRFRIMRLAAMKATQAQSQLDSTSP